MFNKKTVLGTLNKEFDDIAEQMKELIGRDYQGAVDYLTQNSQSDVVNADEKQLIAEWDRVTNIHLAITNISEL
jgi:virulence-associated protein VapD